MPCSYTGEWKYNSTHC